MGAFARVLGPAVAVAVTAAASLARADEGAAPEIAPAPLPPPPSPAPEPAPLTSSASSAPRAAAPPAADAPRRGLALALAQGLNVSRPFAGAQVGYRFERASFLEAFVDYSYDAPISELSFHTLGLGARVYFASFFDSVELYHQSLFGTALSSGGPAAAPKRELGERLLGVFMTQGLGAEVHVAYGFHAGLTLSTGYPVWFRPELAVRYRF
ncbi:MAG: hypothetical protein JNL38_19495 [Myxococcales bacterium]|nr:hypothetical protein [Myxococcales bacterium]